MQAVAHAFESCQRIESASDDPVGGFPVDQLDTDLSKLGVGASPQHSHDALLDGLTIDHGGLVSQRRESVNQAGTIHEIRGPVLHQWDRDLELLG